MQINKWMDGWMNEWMDELTNEWMNESPPSDFLLSVFSLYPRFVSYCEYRISSFEVDRLCYVSGWIWFNVREHYHKFLAHHSTCLESPVLSNKKQTKLFDLHDETLSVRWPWWLHALHNADGTKVVLDNSRQNWAFLFIHLQKQKKNC